MNFSTFSDKVENGDIKLEESSVDHVDTSRDLNYVADPSFDQILYKERIERNLG